MCVFRSPIPVTFLQHLQSSFLLNEDPLWWLWLDKWIKILLVQSGLAMLYLWQWEEEGGLYWGQSFYRRKATKKWHLQNNCLTCIVLNFLACSWQKPVIRRHRYPWACVKYNTLSAQLGKFFIKRVLWLLQLPSLLFHILHVVCQRLDLCFML